MITDTLQEILEPTHNTPLCSLALNNNIQIRPDARELALKEGLWPIFSERNRTMSEIQELHCNLVFTIDGNRPVRSMKSFIVTMILCELDRIDTIFFVKRFFCSCQSKLFASSWCNWPFTLRYLLQISGFRIFWQVFSSRFTCFCTLPPIIASFLIIICIQKAFSTSSFLCLLLSITKS